MASANTHASRLRRYPNCHLVLLIDFDGDFSHRMILFRQAIPVGVKDRVYVLGALTDAETLKRSTGGKFAQIGRTLAIECERGPYVLWKHPQLGHNQSEVQRLQEVVRDFLF